MLMHLDILQFCLKGIKSRSSSFLFSVQINLGLYMQDNSSEFSILVDRSVGGSSIVDGQLELMLHRSLLRFLSIMLIFLSIMLSIFIHYSPEYELMLSRHLNGEPRLLLAVLGLRKVNYQWFGPNLYGVDYPLSK